MTWCVAEELLRDWMGHAAMDGWCPLYWACVTLAPTTNLVQHVCEDHDEDTMHLEHHENLARTVEVRSTVSVQEDFDDINSRS